MSRERSIAIAERYLAAMQTGDWETVEALYHDDIRVHMCGSTPASGTIEGKEALTRGLIATQVHAALDPAAMQFARRWRVMCADAERATILMEGGGPTLSGDRYDQTYLELFRFAEDGRIIEMHAFFDTALAERALFANPLATPRDPAPAMPF